MLAGAAQAFRGGASEALLWGLVARSDAKGRTARYSLLVSRVFLYGMIAEGIGVASGGFLSRISPTLPFICEGSALALGILPLLRLPDGHSIREPHHDCPHPLKHLGAGLHAAWNDPVLLGLLLLTALTASDWQTIFFYNQIYFRELGFTLATIGLIAAAGMGAGALYTWLAPQLMRWLPRRRLVPLLVLVEGLGLLLMSLGQPALGLLGWLGLMCGAASALTPAMSTYLNERCPEAQRATVLSLQTGLFSICSLVFFPLFGLGLTHLPTQVVYSLALVGFALASVAIFVLSWLRRRGQSQRASIV